METQIKLTVRPDSSALLRTKGLLELLILDEEIIPVNVGTGCALWCFCGVYINRSALVQVFCTPR